jgi:hypothetical protein
MAEKKWQVGDLAVVNDAPDTQVYVIAEVVDKVGAQLKYRTPESSILWNGGSPIYMGMLQVPTKAQLNHALRGFMKVD